MRAGIGFDARPAGADQRALAVASRALGAAVLGAAALEPDLLDMKPPELDQTGRDPVAVPAGSAAEDGDASGATTDDERDALAGLAAAVHRLERENYVVVNADVAIRDDRSTGFPGRFGVARLREALAAVLHVSPASVSVRPVGPEGVPGRGDEAQVTALVVVLVDQLAEIDSLHAALRSPG